MPSAKGYKYFGAAKDLPGVRELFQNEPQGAAKKSRSELMRRVNPDYYGFLDEDDGVILQEEDRVQREAFKKLGQEQDAEYVNKRIEEICSHNSKLIEPSLEYSGPKSYVSYVPSIPSQAAIQEELLRLKKEELLRQINEEFDDEDEEMENVDEETTEKEEQEEN